MSEVGTFSEIEAFSWEIFNTQILEGLANVFVWRR